MGIKSAAPITFGLTNGKLFLPAIINPGRIEFVGTERTQGNDLFLCRNVRNPSPGRATTFAPTGFRIGQQLRVSPLLWNMDRVAHRRFGANDGGT